MVAAGCSSSDSAGDGSSDGGGAAVDRAESDGSDSDSSPDDAAMSGELGQGVTDDTITIGLTHLDLDAIREQGVIDTNHGPMAEHMQAMLDHINAEGGVGGRTLEMVVAPYDPIDATASQAACLELTEDNEVFAVLGGVRGDGVLCYTEQHETIAITHSGLTQERLARANAPYASVSAAADQQVEAFIADAAERGLFDGLTVAVASLDAVDMGRDVAVPALEAAGVDVAFESFPDGDGTVGGAAGALSVDIESMRQRDVDAVVMVGDAIVSTNTLITEDFTPTLFLTEFGSTQAVAGRADLSVFPAVYTHGGITDVQRFEEPVFQDECAAVWNAAHPDDPVLNPSEVESGEPNHTVGLGNVCRPLAIFVAAAEAAGPTLNNDTFQAALDDLGPVHLPGLGAGSVSAGKYGAQDEMLTYEFDPARSTSDQGFAVLE